MEIKEISRNYPLSLLLQADPDVKKVEKYLNKGRCFGLFDTEEIVGVYVLKDQKNQTAEIMNLAVKETHRRKGLGRQLIRDAQKRAAGEGFKTLLIATGKDSFQQHFYASCGFDVFETEEGYFTRAYTEPVIDEGKVLTDLVRMKISL